MRMFSLCSRRSLPRVDRMRSMARHSILVYIRQLWMDVGCLVDFRRFARTEFGQWYAITISGIYADITQSNKLSIVLKCRWREESLLLTQSIKCIYQMMNMLSNYSGGVMRLMRLSIHCICPHLFCKIFYSDNFDICFLPFCPLWKVNALSLTFPRVAFQSHHWQISVIVGQVFF